MIPRTISIVALILSMAAAAGRAEPSGTVDPAEVTMRIQLLGVRDDVTQSQYESAAWLRARRQQIIPQLAAALSDPNPRVAEACLSILRVGPADARMVPALLAIAGDAKHPLSAKATLALTPYNTDKQAITLMTAAAADKERFPDARQRARLAVAVGETDLAISLLSAVVADHQLSSDRTEAVRQLEEIGRPAIPALEIASRESDWSVASTSLLALDRIGDKHHARTDDQRQFLKDCGRGFKITAKGYEQRQQAMAKLDRQQIRPFVLQALASDDYQAVRDALGILAIWRDRESLPQIAQLIRSNRVASRGDSMAAYLTIDSGPEGATFFLSQLRRNESIESGYLLRAVMHADMTDDRRLDLLQRARANIKDPSVVPNALRQADEVSALLAPLMDAETNLNALAGYAEVAAADKQKQFGKQVARAMQALADAAKTPGPRDDDFDYDAEEILRAAVTYDLKGMDANLTVLTACDRPVVQVAAIATAIRLGGPLDDGVKQLIARLADGDAQVRRAAVDGLSGLNLTDNAQRLKVESLLLPLLNSPAESRAVRLLAKFGGDESTKALWPLLDDSSMPRALLAAWALAQIDKQASREAGLRRIAIYAIFHHQMYQQGGGIDFQISDGVAFHQTTHRLNPGAYVDRGEAVKLPPELLQPFVLSPVEQQFAVRAYRHTQQMGRGQLQAVAIEMFQPGKVDPSYLPLLRTVAREDVALEAVFVNDKQVAVFPIRKQAAMHVATIIGKPATYHGLAGEEIDSQKLPPQPYKDQMALVARVAIDYVLTGPPKSDPQGDGDWDPISRRETYLSGLVESFGPGLKPALVAEAARRDPADGAKHLRLLQSWVKD